MVIVNSRFLQCIQQNSSSGNHLIHRRGAGSDGGPGNYNNYYEMLGDIIWSV